MRGGGDHKSDIGQHFVVKIWLFLNVLSESQLFRAAHNSRDHVVHFVHLHFDPFSRSTLKKILFMALFQKKYCWFSEKILPYCTYMLPPSTLRESWSWWRPDSCVSEWVDVVLKKSHVKILSFKKVTSIWKYFCQKKQGIRADKCGPVIRNSDLANV